MPGTTDLEKTESPNKSDKNPSEVEESKENGEVTLEGKSASEQNKTSDREKTISEAGTLLAQGKRHLFVKDYPSAVTALGDACSKFSEIYGELAIECGDAYFNYGCALLELAREESGVLDVDNKDNESEESEEGNDEKIVAADDVKKEDNSDKINNTGTDSKTEDGGVKKEDKTDKEESGSKAEGIEADDSKPSDVKGKTTDDDEEEDEEEEEEEDVNNLQLAWEIFELAKRSFEQQNEEIKLAETYLKLGEVELESENYDGAITDIQQCLDLQKKVLPPVSREIAETYFQLGVACSLSNQFDKAIKNFTSAGELLESRIQNLSKMTEPEPEKAKNPFYSLKNEVEEIKALLPEIKEKIIDMEEFKKETMKVVQATIGGGSSKESNDGAGSSTNGTSSSSAVSKGPVNDISHLIRKKRKPEETTESESKKQHLEAKAD